MEHIVNFTGHPITFFLDKIDGQKIATLKSSGKLDIVYGGKWDTSAGFLVVDKSVPICVGEIKLEKPAKILGVKPHNLLENCADKHVIVTYRVAQQLVSGGLQLMRTLGIRSILSPTLGQHDLHENGYKVTHLTKHG